MWCVEAGNSKVLSPFVEATGGHMWQNNQSAGIRRGSAVSVIAKCPATEVNSSKLLTHLATLPLNCHADPSTFTCHI